MVYRYKTVKFFSPFEYFQITLTLKSITRKSIRLLSAVAFLFVVERNDGSAYE